MTIAIDRRVTRIEEELSRVRQEFEAALDAVPAATMGRAPADGWSPAQILWHVAKAERGVARLIARLDAAIGPMETVPPGPSLAGVTGLLDPTLFLDRTTRLAAPEPLRPPDAIDVPGERRRLAEGRAQLIEAARAAGPRLSLITYEHVYFGPFDGWKWFLFCARHEERHLRQLREVLTGAA